ncbi:hypothetical protein EBT31_12235 [bacterium]|nr:hypothetical protein [bacterium]NBX50062.1 hypothetical protein [bacterium]
MIKSDYLKLCRLCTDHFLELERKFFTFCELVYVFDNWEAKKTISTMELANLLSSICASTEESAKLLLVNPRNNLVDKFLEHLETKNSWGRQKDQIKQELLAENLGNIRFVWILDFLNFRSKLNEYSRAVHFQRSPFGLVFSDNFGDGKPGWFTIYEDIKHNFYSKYKTAQIDIVFDALAANYLLSRILAHETATMANPKWQGGYLPWYEMQVSTGSPTMLGVPTNYLPNFKSNYFEGIWLQKTDPHASKPPTGEHTNSP